MNAKGCGIPTATKIHFTRAEKRFSSGAASEVDESRLCARRAQGLKAEVNPGLRSPSKKEIVERGMQRSRIF